MSTAVVGQMQQIHLGLGSDRYEAVSKDALKLDLFERERKAHEDILLANCPQPIWPHDSHLLGCPRPILVSERHRQQLIYLNTALVAAMNDIVPRWWKDKDAKFHERMPLTEEEEDLLQWLDEQEALGNLPSFAEKPGSWRPDFLVEEMQLEDGTWAENFRLSEINARFCFNGYMHASYGHFALAGMGADKSGLAVAAEGGKFFESLLGLFRQDQPLHLLKGIEKGIDIGMFMHTLEKRCGHKPRLIAPADLRLVLTADGNTKLCCLATPEADETEVFRTSDDEAVEEIFQVGVELHQRELVALGRDMWRQISLRCFNDMRTVLLVHDKRMLGIIAQELDGLVDRNVISVAQAKALDRGLAQTILPGSPELALLAREPDEARHDYIMKPVRGGKGAGIVFCEDITAEAWRAALGSLESPKLVDGASMVVQRLVRQRLYDMVLGHTGEVGRYPLVGTYHVVSGQFVGIGIWRSSAERICAVSSGGAWLCSVTSL